MNDPVETPDLAPRRDHRSCAVRTHAGACRTRSSGVARSCSARSSQRRELRRIAALLGVNSGMPNQGIPAFIATSSTYGVITMFKTLKEKIDHVNAAIDEAFGIETADWKKQLIAGVVGVAVYAGIASAGIIATNLLVATLAGTSVFLGVFISIISLMLTFMAALYAATKASTFVLMFDYANIEQRVAGWFGRGAVAKADAVDEVVTTKRRTKAAKAEPQSTRTRRANGLATAH